MQIILPGQRKIIHFSSPKIGLRFEWHSDCKNLYVVNDIGHATLIAKDVLDEGSAHNAVNMFNRGYRYCEWREILKGADNATKQSATEGGILAIAEPD